MSNIEKQALRKRYSAKPTPKCDICGAKMTIQRMSGSRVTYGCSGAIYDETGCHYAEGRSLSDDHYEQSRVTVTDESDPDVLALLDELEAKDKRIAELEAREVVLPSTQDVHPLGPQSAKIFCEFHRSIVNRCADEIRKVGVKVSIKGN
ncbi:ead/Ea22-like family protein [Enterobacter hormaechei]|uniref:ead/Ea22-like family protein n=1 Tax=Enterobacter hormaechei TaxID=158836 RepID=UPI0023B005DF|nr:ead/Ea22-like family protein [Enterobacter hormaechei]MDE7789218.1 ead/Ea22-like family protein [Enterobacter hormaechei]